LLLLDEPFVSIDQEGRAELRRLLRVTLDRHGIPAVLVTHDPDEALALGDALALYERGRTVALGAPEALIGHGHRVDVAGRTVGTPRPLADGRAEVTLSEASVTAAADLLHPDEHGAVRLELHARRRSGGRT
jgi:molybdate transport system ATP-binding protein